MLHTSHGQSSAYTGLTVNVQPNVVISEEDGRPAPGGNFSPLITTQYVARSGAKNAEPSSSEDCALVFKGI